MDKQGCGELFAAGCWSIPTQGHGDRGGDTSPRPHLLCHPLQLLVDVGEEEAEETLSVIPLLAQPAGVVLQEGAGGVCGVGSCWHGVGGWGMNPLGAHQAVLVDAEPILLARLPKHLGVVVCPLAQPAHCRGDGGIVTPSAVLGGPRGVTAAYGGGLGERQTPYGDALRSPSSSGTCRFFFGGDGT